MRAQRLDEHGHAFGAQAVQIEIDAELDHLGANHLVVGEQRLRRDGPILREGRDDVLLLGLEVTEQLPLEGDPFAFELPPVAAVGARQDRLEASIQPVVVAREHAAERGEAFPGHGCTASAGSAVSANRANRGNSSWMRSA